MIKVTEFAERHFDKTFGGTKVLNMSKKKFEESVNYNRLVQELFRIGGNFENVIDFDDEVKMIPGYAPFCKLLFIENFTDARVGSMPITLENYQYLRSGYSARRDSELPTFSRWLDLPIPKPKAKYLALVLYSKEQINKEAKQEYVKQPDGKKFKKFTADWGIVAILGQSHNGEEPMKPETMIRNALGIDEGGSGVALDRKQYMESVAFWDKNATVK